MILYKGPYEEPVCHRIKKKSALFNGISLLCRFCRTFLSDNTVDPAGVGVWAFASSSAGIAFSARAQKHNNTRASEAGVWSAFTHSRRGLPAGRI